MQRIGLTISLALTLFSVSGVSSAQTERCLETAQTQSDLNRCAGASYAEADAELNRVFRQINATYGDDPVFLTRLRDAQRVWIKLRDADFALKYPHENEAGYYGSIFPMCADQFKTELTLQRVAFLKRWLVGVPEGDACSGSLAVQGFEQPDGSTGQRSSQTSPTDIAFRKMPLDTRKLVETKAQGEVQTCTDEVGSQKATILANWCRDVSPATRPPCHPNNPCSLIADEISRSCKMMPDISSCQTIGDRWVFDQERNRATLWSDDEFAEFDLTIYCQDYSGAGPSPGILMIEDWNPGISAIPGAPSLPRGTINLRNLPQSSESVLVVIFRGGKAILETLPAYNLDGDTLSLMPPLGSYGADNAFIVGLLRGDAFALIEEAGDGPALYTLSGSNTTIGKVVGQCD